MDPASYMVQELRRTAFQSDEAYTAYGKSLFVADPSASKQLASPWDNDQFLDAISIPRIEPGNKAKRKPPLTRRQMADMHKEAEEDAAVATGE
jgi:DNA-directed RNA polymerase-3 subunit RPC5